MEELTTSAARSLIDGWVGIVNATAWTTGPRLSDRGPTTVLVPTSKTAARALISAAVQLSFYSMSGCLRVETADEVYSLYEGAP